MNRFFTLLLAASCLTAVGQSEYCLEGTVWDDEQQGCVSINSADINNDGCVQLNDLLDLLTAYGDCGAEESPWQCGDPLEYQGYDYETVQIGEQCWFAENLRAENYADGMQIPNSSSYSEWVSTTEGATSVYENDAANLEQFGRLYNWFAVAHESGLCPNGWHVSAEMEWQELLDFAGGAEIAGETLKSQDFWDDGEQGDDALGFDGRPGGYRRAGDGPQDGYETLGTKGYWWTSTAVNEGQATIFEFYQAEVTTYPDLVNGGFSIRCITDTGCITDAE